MPWTCILLEATDQASLALRCYNTQPCDKSGTGIHEVRALIGTAPIITSERGTWHVESPKQPPETDPRWPAQCVCGYIFEPEDAHQLFESRLYMRQDTGALLTLNEAEPGMLWDAPWFTDFNPPWAGPDGRCLVMRLPGNGEWVIDGPASNGPGWTREGIPPRITARPSIMSHGSKTRQSYHGWLTDGVLSDDLEGRTY